MTHLFTVVAFEVNFMDDVGQTLLNWASAFGTQEMVTNDKHPPAERIQLQAANTFLRFPL